ncbi:hypothetical protein MSPP1_003966 [Malassezia sp. CBS 17886]|nr:hypothetical protein MSPP1_003966 [Malassezia sp. CBS 17886]
MWHEDERMDAMQVDVLLGGKSPPRTHARVRADPGPGAGAAVCRICFEGTEAAAGPGDRLLSPCRCKGTMKLLTSTMFHMVVTMFVFVVAVWAIGATGGHMMQRYQPDLFDGTHPFVGQSLAHTEGAVSEVRVVSTGDASSPRYATDARSSLDLLMDLLLGPIDADDDADNEFLPPYDDAQLPREDGSNLHLYSLGVFQPSKLVQLEQGQLQRLLQLIFAVPAWLASAGQRPRPQARGPLVQRLLSRSLTTVSLGFALIGIMSMFNILLGVSLVGPFHLGIPFVVVGYWEQPWAPPPGGDESLARVTVVWQSFSLLGMLLFVIVLWGIARSMRFFLFFALANLRATVMDWDDTGASAMAHLPGHADRGPGAAQPPAVVRDWWHQRRGPAPPLRDDNWWTWMMAYAGV